MFSKEIFVLRSPEPKKGLTFMLWEPKASTVTTELIYLKFTQDL